ncbi:hypothetical protein QTP70_013773 [Hemibagrus guttatus]|uniref:Uncharacterized protein n=1 Tax=Hemibagrus guttatus TaxID=175788 RepID=A0AAE0PUD5_9TELE|nr:hypothetical protein QTP70_013773 [Hemibagrus guttatus]
MPHREETLGKTQDTLERLCLGTPRDPSEVWASLLRLLPPRPEAVFPWYLALMLFLLQRPVSHCCTQHLHL